MFQMRGVLAVVCILVLALLPCALAQVGRCSKGWGVMLGVKETVLNEALRNRIIDRASTRARTIHAVHKDNSGKPYLITYNYMRLF